MALLKCAIWLRGCIPRCRNEKALRSDHLNACGSTLPGHLTKTPERAIYMIPHDLPLQDSVTGLDLGFRAYKFALQSAARDLLPNERVAHCLRSPAPLALSVHVVKHRDTSRARYKKLVVCSRVWQCPICAYTVSEIKRERLTRVLSRSGCLPVMVTLTVRHHAYTDLKLMLDALIKAYHAVTSGRAYVALAKKFGIAGYIRALEITWGASNGWHPHLHIIFMLNLGQVVLSDEQIDELRAWFVERWLSSLAKFGFDGDELHAVDVKAGDFYVKEYIAKFGRLPRDADSWTLEKELLRGHYKTAHGDDRFTPFALLDDYLFNGNDHSGFLFREYSRAFKGRKQLQASNLFWRLGGYSDDSDDKLSDERAREEDKLSDLFLSLSLQQWRFILKHDLRAALLDVAQSALTPSVVFSWLESLEVQYATKA